MSDLQLGLLALGAIVIAAVILYNWWQERRFSRESIRRFEGPVDDALLDEFRINTDAVVSIEEEATLVIKRDFEDVMPARADDPFDASRDEPDFDAAETPAWQRKASADTDSVPWETPDTEDPVPEPEPEPAPLPWETESVLDDAAPETAQEAAFADEAPAAAVAADQPATPPSIQDTSPWPAGIDAQIDLLAILDLPMPRSGATLREELQPLPELDKPSQWLGQDSDGQWQHLTKDQESASFSRLACSLQLADRSGPVSRETLRNFQLKIDAVANDLGASIEWHDHADPYRYALELDQFCVEVDVMVGFHIVQGSNGAFAGTKLRGLAEAGGMQLGEDGNFHYRPDNGDTLFMLVNQDLRPFNLESLRTAFIRGISFQLDVPRVKNCTEAFNQMALLARQMESSLGGKLVDDNQRPLGDADIDKIRQQLKMIYSRMVARGVIPGSATANRLFS